MLPGDYTRRGRVGANCVDCEMVPVVTRAQYLHLNYVAGETEGGEERGKEVASFPGSPLRKSLGMRLLQEKKPWKEQLMGKAWK